MEARSTTLTPREWEVLECIARGLHYDQIAIELCISPFTVKTHAAKIRRALGATNAANAVYRALRVRFTVENTTCGR